VPAAGGRRLLIVHSSADRYGSDLACLRIATAARDAGWHVDVVLPGDGPLASDLSQAGIATVRLDPIVLRRADLRGWTGLTLPFRWLVAAARLRRFATARERYDVVHSNCAPTLGGALLARHWRAKHVWHVHEIFTSPLQRRVFDALLARAADVVLTCSQAAADQFPRLGRTGKVRVVYTGVDVPAGVPTVAPLSNGAPTLVCVGRLNSWKGQPVLVDAVARLAARGVPVTARLVGSVFRTERHFEQQLRRQVEDIGVAGLVDLLGERQRRDVLDIVAAADIAVLATTRPEPFGMALVEAMTLGRPVVASAAGGPPEYITDGVDGLLVPPGDARALADAVQRLVDDPELARRLGSAARAKVAHLTTARMTAAVLQTYDDALSGKV
jgi:glycosyltransferase involved in cell wall biosynthesis